MQQTRLCRLSVRAEGAKVTMPDEMRRGRRQLGGRKRVNSTGKGRPRVPLTELQKGQLLQGRVRLVLESAVLIKTRAETDAYLPEHAMGDYGPPSAFLPGMQVMCHISRLDPEKDVLHVTMKQGGQVVRGRRRVNAQSQLQPGQVVSGTVKKILQKKSADGWIVNAGVFVDIGARHDAFLEWSDRIPPVGEAVSVRILPDGMDPDEMRRRRRIAAELATEEAVGVGGAVAGAGAVILDESGDDGEESDDENDEDEDDDPYDKYGYLDDY